MTMEDLLKKVLCIINIIFAVFGLAISATGIWFFVQITTIVELSGSLWVVVPWMFIIVGILITPVACIGWSGTSKESCRILRVYGGVMTFMIVFKILSSLMVCVYLHSFDAAHNIRTTVYRGYYNPYQHNILDAAKIERKLKCCGFNDATDYKKRNDLPLSCCADYPCRVTCDYEEAIKRPGCAKAAEVYIKTISFSMAAALLLPILLEISGVIVARRLSHLFKEVEHYSKPIF